MNNYQKISCWNKLFDNYVTVIPEPERFKKDRDSVSRKLALIQEECNELIEAFNTLNYAEMYDAICDIQVTAYGMGSGFGMPLDRQLRGMCGVTNTNDSSTHFVTIKNICLTKRDFKQFSFDCPTKPSRSLLEDPNRIACLKNLLTSSLNCLIKCAVTEPDFEKTIFSLSLLIAETYVIGAYLGLDVDYGVDIVNQKNTEKS